MAVGAVISPRGTVESYQPLIQYLSAKLNRPVKLIQRRTYAELNQLIADGDVDFAFVCTSAYVEGHDQFGMELIAAPLVNGKTVYQSVLIVPVNSDARSMADLRGKIFAFTDPMSLTGRMYPTSLVHDLGSEPETFFDRTFFTYSHDDAIRAVAEKMADGAAVDSLVYDYAVRREPELGKQTRVILRSPDFGIPPAVVSPGIRPKVKAELKNLLLNLSQDPNPLAQEALAGIGAQGFVVLSDDNYSSVRELLKRVGTVQLLSNQLP
jgi:phosphonate transport system substrate-binding protein